MDIPFAASSRPTLGVEWEFGLVDRETRDLVNVADEVFDRLHAEAGGAGDGPGLHRELLRNTVELVTGVCETVPEAMADLDGTLQRVLPVTTGLGVDLFAAGTHPFASWTRSELSEGERYAELISRTQWWGRQMLIWGVHVHVGMPRRDTVMPVLSALLTYFPHLQALSASSPMWAGEDTGYASNRAMMFQQLPTAGLPFQFATWAEFEGFVASQVKTGVIDVVDEIRWDVRPSPRLGTLEVRICDTVSSPRELASLVALTHCLVVDLEERAAAGEQLPQLPPWHVQENKWRSARYGMDAWIITDADSNERLLREDLADLLERLVPVAERLGCREELAGIATIAGTGASYERQRAVAADSDGDLVAVVDLVVRELTLSRGEQTTQPASRREAANSSRGRGRSCGSTATSGANPARGPRSRPRPNRDRRAFSSRSCAARRRSAKEMLLRVLLEVLWPVDTVSPSGAVPGPCGRAGRVGAFTTQVPRPVVSHKRS